MNRPDYRSSYAWLDQLFQHRRSSERHVCKPGDEFGQMKPAIEPILELREVAPWVLGTKGVIRAAKRALDVARNRIDPMKLGMLRTGPPP